MNKDIQGKNIGVSWDITEDGKEWCVLFWKINKNGEVEVLNKLDRYSNTEGSFNINLYEEECNQCKICKKSINDLCDESNILAAFIREKGLNDEYCEWSKDKFNKHYGFEENYCINCDRRLEEYEKELKLEICKECREKEEFN